MTADLALLADPAAELKLLRQLAAESYRAGVDDGRRAGIADTVDWYKRLLVNTVADAQLEQRRRHVCCGPCRRTGHRHGCTRCEDRSRQTYAQDHPDDYRGQDGAR
jgi:hypothetical protein